jgi:hypothetical protein
MDQYRAMFEIRGANWDKQKEYQAFQCMLDNLVSLVKAGRDVILSNTHMNMGWLEKYRIALQFEDVRFLVADFTDVPVTVCRERNAKREGPSWVPDSVITKMAKTFERNPYKDRADLAVFMNTKPFEVKKYEGTPGKPKAIVADLDGTLFHMRPGGRTPYQFARVGEDTVDLAVLMSIRAARAYGLSVVLCSGRDGDPHSRTATEQALAKHAVVAEKLVMRRPGSRIKDSEEKHFLFWDEIAPNFDVQWVEDDRRSVCLTWRAMGLKCFQVQDGDF